jgi:hypothetical protein
MRTLGRRNTDQTQNGRENKNGPPETRKVMISLLNMSICCCPGSSEFRFQPIVECDTAATSRQKVIAMNCFITGTTE